jgi:TonB family protein
MKWQAALVCVLLTSVVMVGQDEMEPYLKSAPIPLYPKKAQQERVQGEVEVNYTINGEGDTSQFEAVSGDKQLQKAAIDVLRTWKFRWTERCNCVVRRKATFVYKLSEKMTTPESPKVSVRWFEGDRFEIEADLLPPATASK